MVDHIRTHPYGHDDDDSVTVGGFLTCPAAAAAAAAAFVSQKGVTDQSLSLINSSGSGPSVGGGFSAPTLLDGNHDDSEGTVAPR